MVNDNGESGFLKGSKFNPYTYNEFQDKWGTDNWHGGWFEHNGLKYGSSDSEHIYSNYPILGRNDISYRRMVWRMGCVCES